MKRKLLLCMGAMLLAGTLAAQVPVPEWETGVEQIKSLIKTDPCLLYTSPSPRDCS